MSTVYFKELKIPAVRQHCPYLPKPVRCRSAEPGKVGGEGASLEAKRDKGLVEREAASGGPESVERSWRQALVSFTATA